MVLAAVVLGPTPVRIALPHAEDALARSASGSLAEAAAQRAIGTLRSCLGLLDEGRELHARGRQTYREAGLEVTAAGWSMSESEIEWRAGEHVAQERLLRDAVATLDELGDQFFFSTVALRLADCLLERKSPEDEEVAQLLEAARKRSLAGDLVNFVYLDGIEARRLAHAGSTSEAGRLALRCAETADTTDNFDACSHAWYALARTLVLTGELDEATRAAARSIEIRVAKGDVAGAAVLERSYAELDLAIA
jgi:hypothetical protein